MLFPTDVRMLNIFLFGETYTYVQCMKLYNNQSLDTKKRMSSCFKSLKMKPQRY